MKADPREANELGRRGPNPIVFGALKGQGSAELRPTLERFDAWLQAYGETSWDHQSYFAGPVGRRAKGLYYRNKALGVVAVAPMIFSEAFFPPARRLFWKKQRFPIADAHYAMGFSMLAKATGDERYLARATHFLEVLEATRSPGYAHYGWGYPFDWVTRNGVMTAGTPLITSTPYVWEAFEAVHNLNGRERWQSVLASIAEHAFNDIPDREIEPGVTTAGYNPVDNVGLVVNASAYRAFLLTAASVRFGREDYRAAAEGNLRFVLGAQKADGSWPYAVDGVRDFVDHFHTCFVMKALAKIDALIDHTGCREAIERGAAFYVDHLFDEQGCPRPFAVAPRLTVYRNELYDYAECINLCTLLAGRFERLDARLASTLADLLDRWVRNDGSFRSRRLILGWDNVPMHRWAQSQIFRSLSQLALATEEAKVHD
jgi:hypothetical protein